MKTFAWILLVIIVLFIVGFVCRQCNTASDVLYKQTNAETVLIRYEWFKDASAQLDAKLADINVQKATVDVLNEQYKGVKRSAWARTDLDAYNLVSQALAGIKMSYNQLAAEYNSNMKKVNFVFCKPNEGRAALQQEYVTQ